MHYILIKYLLRSKLLSYSFLWIIDFNSLHSLRSVHTLCVDERSGTPFCWPLVTLYPCFGMLTEHSGCVEAIWWVNEWMEGHQAELPLVLRNNYTPFQLMGWFVSAMVATAQLIPSQAESAKLKLLRHRDVSSQSDYVPFTIYYLMPKYAPLMSMTFYLRAHKQVHRV